MDQLGKLVTEILRNETNNCLAEASTLSLDSWESTSQTLLESNIALGETYKSFKRATSEVKTIISEGHCEPDSNKCKLHHQA